MSMNISIICFSLTGEITAKKLAKSLDDETCNVSVFSKSKYIENSITEGLTEWTGKHFETDDGIIFVGACGIAVRSIAPYVVSKKTDPAVLVIDECGRYVISVLSGHLGGANELAKKAARILDAVSVITTATDLHGRFAVDVFAKNNNCSIFYMKAAKEASAALLAGRMIGFYSEFPYVGELPKGLKLCTPDLKEYPEIGVAVTVHQSCLPFKSTVQVVPRVVSLGIGCRKDKEFEIINKEVRKCLNDADIYYEAVEKISSISIKKDEAGIIRLSDALEVPFETFSEDELISVKGEFTASEFVKKITGVNNVCERSAVLASQNGKLIKNKAANDGVTTALAIRDWEVNFE